MLKGRWHGMNCLDFCAINSRENNPGNQITQRKNPGMDCQKTWILISVAALKLRFSAHLDISFQLKALLFWLSSLNHRLFTQLLKLDSINGGFLWQCRNPVRMNMKWAASQFTKAGREQKYRIVFQGIHLHMVILLDNLVPPGKEFYSVSYNGYYCYYFF